MFKTLLTVSSFVKTRWYCPRLSRDAIKEHQQKQVIKHTRWLQRHSKYFSSLNPVDSLEDFHTWPLMNKEIMMDHFNAINTAGLDRDTALNVAMGSERTRNFNNTYDGYTAGLSSGTSGHRGLFILSKSEQARWAGNIVAKFLPHNKFFGHRIAFFLRANSPLYESVDSRFLSFQFFDTYSSNEENMKRLHKYNPTILVGPPSILHEISDAINTKQINIHPVKVISVAEVLEHKDKEFFQNTFNLKVIHQAYQCTEGFLAFTCEQGNLHLNEDIVYIEREMIDEHRFIPIVTDFKRKTQPIIRYRLNDIITLSNKACCCGSGFGTIERIEGREDDVFIFASTNNSEVKVFPDIISRCLLFVEGINHYRVVQDQKGLTIYVDERNSDLYTKISDEFMRLATTMNFVLPPISFKEYSYDPSRKLKRVERILS